MSQRSNTRDRYFTAMVGGALVDLTRSYNVSLSGRVLDYGCGVGDLLDALINRGIGCEGADFSAESIAGVNRRFAGQPLFRGATVLPEGQSPLTDESYDVVFFIETIEHLLDEDLDPALSELRRVLNPRGTVVITTPNNDDLAAGEVICPECGCLFHPMQHVRSWTAGSLEHQMKAAGFDKVRCETLYLRPTWLGTKAFTAVRRLLGRTTPHLLYVGEKSSRYIGK